MLDKEKLRNGIMPNMKAILNFYTLTISREVFQRVSCDHSDRNATLTGIEPNMDLRRPS